jgi:hypothetical protein
MKSPVASPVAEQTFADLLGSAAAAGSPDARIRARREELADFVRAVEHTVHQAPPSQRDRVRAMLGWDDASLHRFINSPMVVHSSTHVAMNAFAPMVTFPWFCMRLMTAHGPGSSHLRTQLTHNNLSDNRWKPHVWWRCDDAGRLARTQLFSKQPRFKHQVLVRQRVPQITTTDLTDRDARAVDVARHATNYAYFAAMYRLSLEREVGLHEPDGIVEVPLDLMNTFTIGGANFPRWRAAIYGEGLWLRGIGADNQLYELSADAASSAPAPDFADPATLLVCPNYINLGLSFRLGLSVTMGTDRMAAYWSGMVDAVSGVFRRLGETATAPQLLAVAGVAVDELLALPPHVIADLAEQGGRPSLPLFVAHHGEGLVPALDAALRLPIGTSSIVPGAVLGLSTMDEFSGKVTA